MTAPTKRLLLHVCCGPCATHPLEMLLPDYSVTGFFFNPNIFPASEFKARLSEAERFFQHHKTPLIVPEYLPAAWEKRAAPFSSEPEGGRRCLVCFGMRLFHTARFAAENRFDIFTSTLTIGPNKPARVIFPIAEAASKKHGVPFLAIDFKKRDGHKNSCRISREFNMYRQNYCGCVYSLR